MMKKIIPLIALATLLFPLSSCAQRVVFVKSTVAPAAQGVVKIRKDSNKNYMIKIHIVNLADPGRLTPPMNAYVVWAVTDDNVPKNIGQIKSSKSFLIRKLNGDFESVTVIKPTKIFITAENDVSIQYMHSEIILTTNNF